MTNLYLSTGSNIGDRLNCMVAAASFVEYRIGKIRGCSRVIESEPWGYDSPNRFYNQVLKVVTEKTPEKILQIVLDIEKELGRKRNGNDYSDRIIDIDILFCGKQVIDSKTLKIPHPRLHERGFMLVPMCEISGNFLHPVMRKQIKTLLRQDEIEKEFKTVATANEFMSLLTVMRNKYKRTN